MGQGYRLGIHTFGDVEEYFQQSGRSNQMGMGQDDTTVEAYLKLNEGKRIGKDILRWRKPGRTRPRGEEAERKERVW